MAPRRTVTVTHSVVVPRPPADVWDFTQDFTRRTKPRRLAGLLAPMVERSLRGGRRRAMAKAARVLSTSAAGKR